MHELGDQTEAFMENYPGPTSENNTTEGFLLGRFAFGIWGQQLAACADSLQLRIESSKHPAFYSGVIVVGVVVSGYLLKDRYSA